MLAALLRFLRAFHITQLEVGEHFLFVIIHVIVKFKTHAQFLNFLFAMLGEANITSGRSERSSSGDMKMGTPDAGSEQGLSGSIKMTTGFSRKADSGSINIQTGDALEASSYDTQNSGNITMSIGSSEEGNGGSVMINAGSSYSRQSCKRFCYIYEYGLGTEYKRSPHLF